LVLQPDIQFVQNPGGSRALDDALVIGLRIEVSW
jgi:carbohydrate-selective porin OprB